MSISLCMIVKNEEAMLGRCLKSVEHLVDEMIIVDTGSTDATVKIAKNFGAKVFFYKWNDSFSNARNFALEKATKDWILIMDADDKFEKEDTNKLLNLVNDKISNTNAYFLETICYAGDKPNSNFVINLNIRLIRNRRGYKFVGNIHEQIIPGKGDLGRPDAMKNADIRFHHYGYLNKVIQSKDKRKRNMNLIQKELDENPNNSFMLFSMGNEYYAMQNYQEALKYYMKSYEKFNPVVPYNSKLILRIVSCNEILTNYNGELKFIDEGLKYYPKFTDLEFIRGNLYLSKNKTLYAIRSLKKCIQMGEAPIDLNNVVGVGTYRPYYILSNVYFNLGDYDKSLYYCNKVLKISPKFNQALARAFQIMMVKQLPIDKIKLKLENYFKGKLDDNSYILLSDLFYNQNMFKIAYEYAEKAEVTSKDNSKVYYYKGNCLFYQKLYKEAYKCFMQVKENNFIEKAIYYSTICKILVKSIRTKNKLIKKCDNISNNKHYLVCIEFKKIIEGKKTTILADNRDLSSEFIKPIFDLLEILLKQQYFDKFEKALQLLNLIDNDSVLLILAKLYYKYGYFKLANKEFMRSIKMNDKIDVAGLEMMKRTISYKA
ncbi:MAG: glycosyltransferase [Clostridium sp.]|nr:glycosyltransferase [Clostridium sp.]